MSTFEEMGFLSDYSEATRKGFGETYPEWKAIYFAINNFSFPQLHKVEILNDDKQSLLILSCYYRILSLYQAAFLLIERGSDSEAKGLLRNQLETLLVISAAFHEKDFTRKYVLSDTYQKMKMVEDAIEAHENLKARHGTSFYTDAQVTELRNKIAADKARLDDPTQPNYIPKWHKTIPTKDLAIAAKLEDVYKQRYSYLCKFAHPSPTGMRDYLEVTDKGVITGFKVVPREPLI